MREITEIYKEETGKDWMINPVCHGELGFASWDYQLWLEAKVQQLYGEPKKFLEEITDDDIISCAKIAGVDSGYEIKRFGGRDDGGIDVEGKSGKNKRSLRIYYNGSNTRITHNGFEVIECCFQIYDYLRSIGYNVRPNKITQMQSNP